MAALRCPAAQPVEQRHGGEGDQRQAGAPQGKQAQRPDQLAHVDHEPVQRRGDALSHGFHVRHQARDQVAGLEVAPGDLLAADHPAKGVRPQVADDRIAEIRDQVPVDVADDRGEHVGQGEQTDQVQRPVPRQRRPDKAVALARLAGQHVDQRAHHLDRHQVQPGRGQRETGDHYEPGRSSAQVRPQAYQPVRQSHTHRLCLLRLGELVVYTLLCRMGE